MIELAGRYGSISVKRIFCCSLEGREFLKNNNMNSSFSKLESRKVECLNKFFRDISTKQQINCKIIKNGAFFSSSINCSIDKKIGKTIWRKLILTNRIDDHEIVSVLEIQKGLVLYSAGILQSIDSKTNVSEEALDELINLLLNSQLSLKSLQNLERKGRIEIKIFSDYVKIFHVKKGYFLELSFYEEEDKMEVIEVQYFPKEGDSISISDIKFV